MSTFDTSSLFLWWFTLFALGIIFIPSSLLFFSSFFDKGYLFSKVIGLTIISCLVYFLGIFHLMPFTHTTLVIVCAACTILNLYLITTRHLRINKKLLWIFLGEEVMFFLCILTWSHVRSFQPDIHGLEKYMDFGFVNSILRSTYFPPRDMWYTPLPINYYYFGHLTTAVLTRLSNIPASITYNLMIASLFAFAFSLAFSLTGNLMYLALSVKKVKQAHLIISIGLSAVLGALLLSLGGNLHTIYSFFATYPGEKPAPFWQLAFLPNSFPNAYWYPNATRFIYHTIHEFPLYSFVVSDLHGHVLDIPNVLLSVALMITIIMRTTRDTIKELLPRLFFLGFLFAIMYMTNAWDSIIYFGLWFFLLVFAITMLDLKKLALMLIIPFGTFFILSRPFSHFFNVSELVSGVGILCAPDFLTQTGKMGPFLFEANHCQHSPLYQLLILYGLPLLAFIVFSVFMYSKKYKEKITQIDMIVLTLFIFGLFLVIIPEFVYLKDIYPEHYRANTMFKLVYQSFMLFGIATAYALVRMYALTRNKFLILFVPFLFLVMLYPYFAIPSYYNNLTNPVGLDGTRYLTTLYPSDSEAINWINTHITGQPTILEAQGDSYTDYGRISTNTGLPTVLGWTVHEWLWRGSYNPLPERFTDVQTIYETKDIVLAKQLLQKYNLDYVFVGTLEREKYKALSTDKFTLLGTKVYDAGTTQIYKINK